MSKERIDAWETVVAVTQHVERGGVGPRSGEAFSAFTVAEALDRLARHARTLTRLYVMRINGEHEKCPRCDGTGNANRLSHGTPLRSERCPAACKDGHRWPEEVVAFSKKVSRTEERIMTLGKELGVHVELEDCGGWSVRLFSSSGEDPKEEYRRLGGFG